MFKILISFIVLISALTFFASGYFIMNFETTSDESVKEQQTSDVSESKQFQTENIYLPEMQNPRIVVKKADRKLQIFDGEKLIKTYQIGLGFTPEGDKEKQGDGKTPEGDFYIFTKNDQSKYYLSLGVSYPSIDDAEKGFREKLISENERDKIIEAIKSKKMPLQNTKLGGEIYIHGNGSKEDWTLGCVALEDAEMKELFEAIPIGTNVKIEP